MKEKEYVSVAEIAKMFDVTIMGVKYWIDKGLEFKIEKVKGKKPRRVICVDDVHKFLNEGLHDRGGF